MFVVVILLLSGCTSPAPLPLPQIPELSRHNVIMISLDTLRRDHLGAYGCPDPVSPLLDRLAQRSVVCEDVASQSASTWTSHRSLFTGQYIAHHSAGDPLDGTTLASHFRDNGYATAAIVDGGKMHRRYGHAVGFEEYDDAGGRLEAIIPRAQQWITDHRETPFFLFLHTYDIHAPYNPLQHDDQVFLSNPDDIPVSYRTEAPIYLNTLNLNQTELKKLADLYKGGVRSCDRQLTELFNFLKAEGILTNTLVVFVSDHGESLGERMHLGHHEMYYAQLAVPLMMMIPEFPSRIVHGTVENIDIMPTLLDLMAWTLPEAIQGLSLRTAIVQGKVNQPERWHHAEHKRRTLFRDLDWKAIIGKDSSQDELYNLAVDPAEETNLIDQEQPRAQRMIDAIPGGLTYPGLDVRHCNENHKNLPLNISREKEDHILRQQLETLGYLSRE